MSTAQGRSLVAWNRGIISPLGLGRVDLGRTAMSAETMTNWVPRVLGSMMLRPGLQYIDGTKGNGQAKMIAAVFEADDQAHIEITASVLRVRINDSLVSRAAVTAAITNGNFDSDIASWTDADEAGAASTWETGGYAELLGDGTNAAILRQQVTVNETGTEHALRVVVQRGPVGFRVGSSAGDDDYINETFLGTGTHSLTFTPSGDFYVDIFSRRKSSVLVDSVNVESSGTMEIATPWAAADFPLLRYRQSGDVFYLACDGYQQRKIERRSANSWSVVLYEPETGPFRTQNTSNITMAPSALYGDITITASKSFFKSTHVGSLMRIASNGQEVAASVTAEDTFTDAIRVVGNGDSRKFSFIISGSFTATVTIQYSVGSPGAWVDRSTTYSAPTSSTITDGFDGQVIYYRIGVKSGDFTSGTVTVSLIYASGSIEGIARITAFTSDTLVSAVSLKDFGGTDASKDWWEAAWSDFRGYPTACSLTEGRLGWHGNDKSWHSVSDAYEDFDDTVEGDAGPISRSIGEGPIASIHWVLELARIHFGTALNSANIDAQKIQGDILPTARSSSLDEPLTPTNYNIKYSSSLKGIYVDRSKQRLFEIAYSIEVQDYVPTELTLLVPDLNGAGIAGIAVQMKPDIRIHCWRDDGTVGMLVYDRVENVICWCEIETDGDVEDVTVLPGDAEDQVYYVVKRTINSSTVRYVEKWALESECVGGDLNKQADSFVVYDGAATMTPFTTELAHLAAETVVIWADGVYVGTDTVTVAGALSSALATAASKVVVGLSYTAQFKTAKQAIANQMGFQLGQRATIPRIGLVLYKTHAQGLQVGMDFNNLRKLPLIRNGAEVDEDAVIDSVDDDAIPIDSTHTTDPRICLQASAPKPCTVIAATFPMRRGMAA